MPCNVGDIAASAEGALSGTRRARGETAYEQIRDGYAWDTIATRVVSLYEDLLANTAPPN
jgi:hypothetical protein